MSENIAESFRGLLFLTQTVDLSSTTLI